MPRVVSLLCHRQSHSLRYIKLSLLLLLTSESCNTTLPLSYMFLHLVIFTPCMCFLIPTPLWMILCLQLFFLPLITFSLILIKKKKKRNLALIPFQPFLPFHIFVPPLIVNCFPIVFISSKIMDYKSSNSFTSVYHLSSAYNSYHRRQYPLPTKCNSSLTEHNSSLFKTKTQSNSFKPKYNSSPILVQTTDLSLHKLPLIATPIPPPSFRAWNLIFLMMILK